MQEYPQFGMTVSKYFKDNYIEKQLSNGSCGRHFFRNMYQAKIYKMCQTNNKEEAWQITFINGVGRPQPSFVKHFVKLF